MIDLTVLIITKNEAVNLKKCIQSFNGIAKRFVIIDSYSTDNTKEIANNINKELSLIGSRLDFYQHPFVDHASQINWGLENTNISTEWTMRIDADEELTIELVDEIKNKLSSSSECDFTGIILKRRVYFMGRWMKHGGRYPEFLLRIFKTGHAKCEQRKMDEHIILLDGYAVKFNNDFIDNNPKQLDWWVNKHNWYSNKEVLDYFEMSRGSNQLTDINNYVVSKQAKMKRNIKNKKYYKLPKFFRAHIYYIYRYYFRFGFLDGTEGKIFNFLQAYWYRFLVDAKIFECEKLGTKMKSQGDLKA